MSDTKGASNYQRFSQAAFNQPAYYPLGVCRIRHITCQLVCGLVAWCCPNAPNGRVYWVRG